MKLSLLREEMRRPKRPASETTNAASATHTVQWNRTIHDSPLALSMMCDGRSQDSHFRCQSQWCECLCHKEHEQEYM